MNLKIITTILLCFVLSISFAQVTGYAGKRLIINTDIMDAAVGFGGGAGVEYAFARKMSGTLDYGYTQKIKRHIDYKDIKSKYFQHTTKVGIKLYAHKGFNAPKGGYYFFRFGVSQINSKGKYVSEDEYLEKIVVSFEEKNIRAYFGDMGYGHQWIIKKWVTVDLALGVTIGGTRPGGHDYAEEFGPNILSVAMFGGTVGYTMGLTGNLKIGILLPI